MDDKKTTIRKYENLKVYEVDASDAHFKKYTPKTLNGFDGKLKVYLDENLNQVYFKIYTVLNGNSERIRQVLENLSLSDIDLDEKLRLSNKPSNSGLPRVDFGTGVVRVVGKTNNGEQQKRVEFKKKEYQTNRAKIYYAVEFTTNEGFDDLLNTFAYLTEMYNVPTTTVSATATNNKNNNINNNDDVEMKSSILETRPNKKEEIYSYCM